MLFIGNKISKMIKNEIFLKAIFFREAFFREALPIILIAYLGTHKC
jgi:hypothetical protein